MPTWPTTAPPTGAGPTLAERAAALAAAHACERVAAALRWSAAEHHRLAVAATKDWHGPARQDFDRTLSALDRAGRGLEAEARAQAQALRAAADTAGQNG